MGPLDTLCTLHSGEGYEELAESAVIKGDQALELKTIDLETLSAHRARTAITGHIRATPTGRSYFVDRVVEMLAA